MVRKAKSSAVPLCVIIKGPSLHEVREQIKKALLLADMLEFRVDLFEFGEPATIASLIRAAEIPVIITLRGRSHGGDCHDDEDVRIARLYELAALNPAYIDLESDLSIEVYREVASISPATRIISSFHNFSSTPKNLEVLIETMMEKPASLYKVSTMAHSSVDALRMLHFICRCKKKGISILGICMGNEGASTRILGPIFGNALTFAALSSSELTAPGQLPARELIDCYHYRRLSEATVVCGLIGDHVEISPGHILHNRAMEAMGLDAVYVKFNVSADALEEFLIWAEKLRFRGLAVTMPHKERVLSFVTLSEGAAAVGAVNTLLFVKKGIVGYNTDGEGALGAIEKIMDLSGKRVVILGAGGASRAIAFELQRKGASLTILNRNAKRAQALAEEVGACYGTLDEFVKVAAAGYDLLVNATPVGAASMSDGEEAAVDIGDLIPGAAVMDIIPGDDETPLVVEAQRRHCPVIVGDEMLTLQAVGQYRVWFAEEVGIEDVKEALMMDRSENADRCS